MSREVRIFYTNNVTSVHQFFTYFCSVLTYRYLETRGNSKRHTVTGATVLTPSNSETIEDLEQRFSILYSQKNRRGRPLSSVENCRPISLIHFARTLVYLSQHLWRPNTCRGNNSKCRKCWPSRVTLRIKIMKYSSSGILPRVFKSKTIPHPLLWWILIDEVSGIGNILIL